MNKKESIEQRIPVWQAISKFVLDGDLSHKEIDEIVNRCNNSAYTVSELEKIYRYEVIPSIHAASTMFSDLDSWAGFNDKEQIYDTY